MGSYYDGSCGVVVVGMGGVRVTGAEGVRIAITLVLVGVGQGRWWLAGIGEAIVAHEWHSTRLAPSLFK